MADRKKAFHSTNFAETASASDEAMMPVKRFTLWRSTISCALRTQLAGLPCVSSKRNSTLRPRMPPRSSTSFCTSLHVRTTCAPSAAHVPVIAVGTPMRMGPLPCAHARLRKAGEATTDAAAAVVTRNSRLLAVIAVLLSWPWGASALLLYHDSGGSVERSSRRLHVIAARRVRMPARAGSAFRESLRSERGDGHGARAAPRDQVRRARAGGGHAPDAGAA